MDTVVEVRGEERDCRDGKQYTAAPRLHSSSGQHDERQGVVNPAPEQRYSPCGDAAPGPAQHDPQEAHGSHDPPSGHSVGQQHSLHGSRLCDVHRPLLWAEEDVGADDALGPGGDEAAFVERAFGVVAVEEERGGSPFWGK